MHSRVLIVGTVPYNTKSTSRAFDAYFIIGKRIILHKFSLIQRNRVKDIVKHFFKLLINEF